MDEASKWKLDPVRLIGRLSEAVTLASSRLQLNKDTSCLVKKLEAGGSRTRVCENNHFWGIITAKRRRLHTYNVAWLLGRENRLATQRFWQRSSGQRQPTSEIECYPKRRDMRHSRNVAAISRFRQRPHKSGVPFETYFRAPSAPLEPCLKKRGAVIPRRLATAGCSCRRLSASPVRISGPI